MACYGVVAALLGSLCAAPTPQERLDPLIGVSVSRAIVSFGAPETVFDQSDGSRVFVWQSRRQWVDGATVQELKCTLSLIAIKRDQRTGAAMDDWEISNWEEAGQC